MSGQQKRQPVQLWTGCRRREFVERQALAFRFTQPQTAVARNSTRPMIANQRRPFTAKPRIERTSQMISSVIISPIYEAYATPMTKSGTIGGSSFLQTKDSENPFPSRTTYGG